MTDKAGELPLKENLAWAWEKVRKQYRSDAGWRDEAEIAAFESNLPSELSSIGSSFRSGNYTLRPIRFIPQPKSRDQDGRIRLRPMYWVSVRDQVAWTALVNILGPHIDDKMPAWSYGNRLYRPAWNTVDGDLDHLHIGPYRHTSGNLYRTFSQSWTLYRRHIYLTLHRMAASENREKYITLDVKERALLNAEDRKEAHQRLAYLREDFWRPMTAPDEIYWATIDFKTFYPRLDVQRILSSILKYSPNELLTPQIRQLLSQLLQFEVNSDGWSEDDLKESGYDASEIGLPTGLMVAGFLANTALLDVDAEIDQQTELKQIAHFRYVDDHVVLARTYEDLLSWISTYRRLVEVPRIASFNLEKLGPEALCKVLESPSAVTAVDFELAKRASRLNQRHPKPFLTRTLAKLSNLGQINFDLLDESETEAAEADLEFLLLADIPDSEVRKSTRLSFAAGKLARLRSSPRASLTLLADLTRQSAELGVKLRRLRLSNPLDTDGQISDLEVRQFLANVSATSERQRMSDALTKKQRHTFYLLLQVIHENPEKLRLWQRALEYCRSAGFAGIQDLLMEIREIISTDPIAGAYLYAFFVQELTANLLRALSPFVVVDGAPVSLETESRYVSFIRDAASPLAEVNSRTLLFVEQSERLFAVAKKVAMNVNVVLGDSSIASSTESGVDSGKVEDFWRELPVGAATPGAVAWWLERGMSQVNSDEPTLAWKLISSTLPPNEHSWRAWKQYPSALPEIALQSIWSSEVYLPESEAGWILDAERSTEGIALRWGLRPIGVANAPSPALRAIQRHLQWRGSSVSLPRWADLTKQWHESDSSDPRAGEWTALRIVQLIAEEIVDPSNSSSNARLAELLIPENIAIPERWLTKESEIVTWEYWRHEMANPKLGFCPSEGTLQDRRIIAFEEYGDQDFGWQTVRALGLILLGLLRRSFAWPASWNAGSSSLSWSYQARAMIGSLSCSTLSTSILEACLLDRSRESFLIPSQQHGISYEPDDFNDPQPLPNALEVSGALLAAQKILERLQISVLDQRPRQLIPVGIEQLARLATPAGTERDLYE